MKLIAVLLLSAFSFSFCFAQTNRRISGEVTDSLVLLFQPIRSRVAMKAVSYHFLPVPTMHIKISS
jgi:hypothetical protein